MGSNDMDCKDMGSKDMGSKDMGSKDMGSKDIGSRSYEFVTNTQFLCVFGTASFSFFLQKYVYFGLYMTDVFNSVCKTTFHKIIFRFT